MGRARYSWQKVYASALRGSDPRRLLAHIEQATLVLEKRAAEWGTRPGTPAELKEIRKAVATLRKRLKGKWMYVVLPRRVHGKSS
jgi:DNA-binding GntR family transcriptional regulator